MLLKMLMLVNVPVLHLSLSMQLDFVSVQSEVHLIHLENAGLVQFLPAKTAKEKTQNAQLALLHSF